ncbi:MAG: bifunctional serine/threonine-protein kinase/formylglycine-generating enzyme family protein [Gemmataceae bacterium]
MASPAPPDELTEQQTKALIQEVITCGMFDASQIESFRKWVEAESPNRKAIVKELLMRYELTHFQVHELVKGRGKDLILGSYKLIDLLGEGGMGRVFRAKHLRLGRDVALKLIRKEKLDNPNTVERFRQEVRVAAQLIHPNVVHSLDADEANGYHYYTMEYVEGVDLTKWVRDHGPMPIVTACEAIRQAALGLQHAYERGIVHRDLKPSNILLDKEGKAKLTDLGLATLNDQSDCDARVTQSGIVLGTPDFVAPEQARDSRNVDTRADLYSLAATLFYCLTGNVPYDAPSSGEKLIMHVKSPIPSVLTHKPELPAELDQVIRWAMAKEPENRPQTPLDFAHALEPFCSLATLRDVPKEEISLFDTIESSPVIVRRRRRFPFVKFAIVASVAIAFGSAGIWVWNTVTAIHVTLNSPHVNHWGMELIQIPAGTFSMGSPDEEPDREEHEGPVREVTISAPFYMGRTEVTNQQFREVMGTSPSRTAMKARNSDPYPVDSVTWTEAVEFCNKLTRLDQNRIPRGWEYRLPTEAEWEFACRAGSRGAFTFEEPPVPKKQAVYNAKKEGDDDDPVRKPNRGSEPVRMTQVAGQTEANAFGLTDMHGNVWEWTSDYFQRDRGREPATDPKGPKSGDFRVIRGGGWDSTLAQCRNASRDRLVPTERRGDVGFRVVLAPAPGR